LKINLEHDDMDELDHLLKDEQAVENWWRLVKKRTSQRQGICW
jgi:hypothetical protein